MKARTCTCNRLRANVPRPKPSVERTRVGPGKLGHKGAANVSERDGVPSQRHLALGVDRAHKGRSGARRPGRRQSHRVRRYGARTGNAHRSRHSSARRRRLHVELRLVSTPHLAARKLEGDHCPSRRARERGVVHKAPPLHHVVDAVDGVTRRDIRGRGAHVEVEVGVVADRERAVGQAVQKRLGACLLVREHLLHLHQVEAVGHRQLGTVRVDVHGHRPARDIHAARERLPRSSRLKLPSRAAGARAGHVNGDVGCGRVAARAVLVQVSLPTSSRAWQMCRCAPSSAPAAQAPRADHIEAKRADVEQPRPAGRAHAGDRRKVNLPRVRRVRDRPTKRIPGGARRPRATRGCRAREQLGVETKHELELGDHRRRVQGDRDAKLRVRRSVVKHCPYVLPRS